MNLTPRMDTHTHMHMRTAYIYPCPMLLLACDVPSVVTFARHRSVFEDRTVRLRVRTAFQICRYSYVVALKLPMPSSVKHVSPRGCPVPLFFSPPYALIRQQLRREKERTARAETMAALLLGPFGLLRGQGTQESQQGDAGQRPPNTACVELENFANAQYTAAMQIGSPAQTLKMIPDSGSSDLVVPSADCGAEDGCIGSQHSKFDAQRSSTSQGPFGLVDVAYGQGETECEIIRDVARLDSLQVDQLGRPTLLYQTMIT